MATTSSVNWQSNDHYYSKVTPFLGDYTPASCHFSAGRSTISRQSQVKTGRRLHLLDLNTLDNRLTQTDLTLVKTRCSKIQWGRGNRRRRRSQRSSWSLLFGNSIIAAIILSTQINFNLETRSKDVSLLEHWENEPPRNVLH